MQFTIPRDTILPVLGALSRTARPNGPLPQLGFAQVTATVGTIRLFATNLKWSVTHELPCAGITQPGQGAIPAKLVTDFVGQLPAESVSFTWHPDTLRLDLACRGFQAQLPGWNPEELPAPPGAGALPLTTLPAPTLRTLVESVGYAAADDATKVLSNVLFHFHAQHLTLVGADGFRLVRRSTPLDTLTLPTGAETPDLQVLVPAAVAAELAAGLPEAKGSQETLVTLALTPDQHHLIVQAPGWTFAARLADGAYVDYAKFVAEHEAPTKSERGTRNAEQHPLDADGALPRSDIPLRHTQVRLLTAELLKALRIAESFAADTHHSVQLELLPAADPTDPGQVRVGAASERGSTLALVDAVIAGAPLTVAFNTKLLREALANLGHPHTVLRLRTPTTPAIVAPPETAGTDHLCLLMPLALASRAAAHPASAPQAAPASPAAEGAPVAAAA